MFGWLKNSRVARILIAMGGIVVFVFGSLTGLVEYVQTILGIQFQTFNSLQVILVSIGIMIVFLSIYDYWRTRKRGLDPRAIVVCKKCGNFFDLQNPQAYISLSQRANLATGTCPRCGDRASHPRKEWFENLYDAQQGK